MNGTEIRLTVNVRPIADKTLSYLQGMIAAQFNNLRVKTGKDISSFLSQIER